MSYICQNPEKIQQEELCPSIGCGHGKSWSVSVDWSLLTNILFWCKIFICMLLTWSLYGFLSNMSTQNEFCYKPEMSKKIKYI